MHAEKQICMQNQESKDLILTIWRINPQFEQNTQDRYYNGMLKILQTSRECRSLPVD